MIESHGPFKYFICNICRKKVDAPMPIDWEETFVVALDTTYHYCGDCRKPSIAEKIKMIIGEHILKPELTTPFLSCADDWFANAVPLILANLEGFFDLNISDSDEDLKKMKTVGDVVKYIERRLEEE